MPAGSLGGTGARRRTRRVDEDFRSRNGQTPIQVIERGDAGRIWRMIFQIDAGVAN